MNGRVVNLAAAMAIAALLPACGDGGGGGKGPTSSSAALVVPRTTVVLQTTFVGLPPFMDDFMVWAHPFRTFEAGTLDFRVDWTFATNDLDFAVFRGAACSDTNIDTPSCPMVGIAQSMAKPETLKVANASADQYLLVIFNVGPATESGTAQILLTTGAGASAEGAAAASAGAGGMWRLGRPLFRK